MNGWVALVLAVFCGASLSVCFKLFSKFGIDTLQGVFFNYVTAIVVSLFLGGGADGLKAVATAPWVWLAALEGVGFMGGILILAASSKRAGVALTNTSARASLVVPVILSYLVFKEHAPNWIAIVMVLVAMILIFGKKSGGMAKKHSLKDDLMPLAVFATYGVTDFLLKVLKAKAGADSAQGGIMLFIFSTAAVLCVVAYLVRGDFKNHPFTWKAVAGGVVLGLFNSFCTALMLKALGTIDAVVFYPVYNVSVVFLSLLIGIIFFGERFLPKQLAGVLLAAAAIVLLVI